MEAIRENDDTTQPQGAWLVPLSDDVRVVLAPGEVKYLEHPHHCIQVPGLPAYSAQAFVWRDQFVPLIHLPQLLGHRPLPLTAPKLVAIVLYQTVEQKSAAFGALPLTGLPEYIRVASGQARPVDDLPAQWPHLSAAALSHEDRVYPVLDLARLFGSTPQDLIASH